MHCGRVAKITHSKKKTNISQETLQEEKIKGTYSLYSSLRGKIRDV